MDDGKEYEEYKNEAGGSNIGHRYRWLRVVYRLGYRMNGEALRNLHDSHTLAKPAKKRDGERPPPNPARYQADHQ